MKCMNCYQEISDSCKFCPNCGAKQPVQKMEPVSQVKEETIDNITEDTAEVQQPTEKVQPEEDVLPEEKVQPTEPTQPEDVEGSYQNDPYKSVTQEQNNFNGMPQKPVNWVPYLILSIISTLCCCLPFGVVGIVFSAKINSAMLAGNLEEAQNNAKMARIWIIVSFAIGLLTWLIYMVLIVTGAVSGSAYYYY